MIFPNDADGDALSKVAEHADMSKPMDLDFAVAVPSESAGRAIAELVVKLGYSPAVELDEATQRWTCYCTKRMVPTHATVVAAQKELGALSAVFGGYSDGWGTLGN